MAAGRRGCSLRRHIVGSSRHRRRWRLQLGRPRMGHIRWLGHIPSTYQRCNVSRTIRHAGRRRSILHRATIRWRHEVRLLLLLTGRNLYRHGRQGRRRKRRRLLGLHASLRRLVRQSARGVTSVVAPAPLPDARGIRRRLTQILLNLFLLYCTPHFLTKPFDVWRKAESITCASYARKSLMSVT